MSPAPSAGHDPTHVRALAAHAETALARAQHDIHENRAVTPDGVILTIDFTGLGCAEVRITAAAPAAGACRDITGLVSPLLAAVCAAIEDAFENAGMEILSRAAQDGQPSLSVDATPFGTFAVLIGDRQNTGPDVDLEALLG